MARVGGWWKRPAYEPTGSGVPEFEAEAGGDVAEGEGGCDGGLQFFEGRHGFGQAVEGDFRVQVMDVVIADVSGEPTHHAAGAEVA